MNLITKVLFAGIALCMIAMGPAEADGHDRTVLLVDRDLGIKSVNELEGGNICVFSPSPSKDALLAYFVENNMGVKMRSYISRGPKYGPKDTMMPAFEKGECDAMAVPFRDVEAAKNGLKDPTRYVLLPDVIPH